MTTIISLSSLLPAGSCHTLCIGIDYPMKQKYKYILIDADETILDFHKTETIALNNTADYLDFIDPLLFKETFTMINIQTWKDLEAGLVTADQVNRLRFEQLHGALSEGYTLKRNVDQLADFYLTQLGEGDYLIEGAQEFMDYLKDKYTLILATNGLSQVQRSRMKKCGLGSYFDSLAISGELGSQKPMASYFSLTMKDYQYKKEELLMIGDSLASDMAGAEAFGIDSCWVNLGGIKNRSPQNPTYVISALSQICDIL